MYSTLRKWLVSGSEQARLHSKYEDQYVTRKDDTQHHNDEGVSKQKTFIQEAVSLVDITNRMRIPFLLDSAEFLNLNKSDVRQDFLINTVGTIESTGHEQNSSYTRQFW